jgi:hypothetical protein
MPIHGNRKQQVSNAIGCFNSVLTIFADNQSKPYEKVFCTHACAASFNGCL